jgi:protocatechuate 3,4-dioxygenase beta subunit
LKKNLYPDQAQSGSKARSRSALLAAAVAVISLTVFFACSKTSSSDNGSGTNPNNIPAEQTVTASLQGRVVDEKGMPVQGAAVSSGSATTVTDVNGVFSFSRISMSSRFGFVKAAKQGYFTGSRSIITNAGASNYVSIQLVPRVLTGSFGAAAGKKVLVATGDTADFTGSSFVNASTNAAYAGNVNVYATYLDPTDAGLYKYMPGDLRGIGKDGNETALQSYGMLGVELQGDAGEKLQLAPGKKATLTWAIPAALQATAPVTIPLWYFNDSSGRWVEEGSAVRVGNSYVGQVGHFSYWNCDAAAGTVNFKVHVKDQHGNPLAYTYIQFQSQGWGTRGGYTDSAGFAQGLIPKGQSLVMQVVTDCGNMLAGANVGPALSDQDLGTVTVTIDHADIVVKGTVVDCSLNPVDSGFVSVHIDGLNYNAAVVKGAFVLPVTRCYSSSTTALLTPADFKTSQQGSQVSVAVGAADTVDAGQLTACGVNISQVIQFSIGGSSYSLTTPPDDITESAYGGLTFIQGGNQSQSIRMQFSNLNGTTGAALDSVYITTPAGWYQGGYLSCTISSFGPVGGVIEGSFTGPMYGSSGPQQTVMGTFKVKRTN